MKETAEDQKWDGERTNWLNPPTPPTETEKIVVSLLMRLYDVQMAILTKMDEETAGKLYDSHNEGIHFNPEIYVPDWNTHD